MYITADMTEKAGNTESILRLLGECVGRYCGWTLSHSRIIRRNTKTLSVLRESWGWGERLNYFTYNYLKNFLPKKCHFTNVRKWYWEWSNQDHWRLRALSRDLNVTKCMVWVLIGKIVSVDLHISRQCPQCPVILRQIIPQSTRKIIQFSYYSSNTSS